MIDLYRAFPFPLNIYAWLLDKEVGSLDYLHYGLFAPGCATIAQAQAWSTQLVMDRLPAVPARILEVGTGLGTTLHKLRQMGHDVTGVNPDPLQIEFAQARFGLASHIACARLEDFDAAGRHWDMVLFQESAQYIAPDVLFGRVASMLAPGGTLLIVDEVSLRRVPSGTPQGLPLLDDVLAIASSNGFMLKEQLDLSAFAAPTVDHMLELTLKGSAAMQAELGVTPAQIESLNASNRLYREKYADGRYGYALLRFTR